MLRVKIWEDAQKEFYRLVRAFMPNSGAPMQRWKCFPGIPASPRIEGAFQDRIARLDPACVEHFAH